jgi:hypothetical protein
MKHINSISCGQGAPSLFLIVMAGEGLFPADLVVVADTGWENDCLWSTGERTTNKEFFERVTKPLAESYGIDAAFSRSLDENKVPYLPIPDSVTYKQTLAGSEKFKSPNYGLDIPMFGSNGGRLRQSCTSKWKIQAIHQEVRRRGATTSTTALGLHRDEVHRVKPSKEKWDTLCWPLVDMAQTREGGTADMGIGRTWDRATIQAEMEKRGIPYLVTTECDGCPHKNWERWKRTSQETIDELALFEAKFNGEFFLTSARIPLKKSLAAMQLKNEGQASFDDICDSGYCFL